MAVWEDKDVFAVCFALAAHLSGYERSADIPPAEALRLSQLVRAQMDETAAAAAVTAAELAAKGRAS